MPRSEPGGLHGLNLLAEMQGRPIEKAFQLSRVRAALEAEASYGTDVLITPGALELLRELIARKTTLASVAHPGTVQPELFHSTDIVVIVPGFMASALRDRTRQGLGLLWLNPAAFLGGRIGSLQLGPYDGTEADLTPGARISPAGPLPLLYDLLRLALELRRYHTVIFAVDWRKDLDLASRKLAARLRQLAGQKRPIHIVAHSQGALVARRALQRLGPELARQIVRHLVLLGPANYGSFSAALALAGTHSMLSLARRLAPEPPPGFQRVLASMSGLYQLLPWAPERVPWLAQHDLSQPGFWTTEIDALRLKTFCGWGRAIDTPFFLDRIAVILGDNHGLPTPGGLIRDASGLRALAAHGLAGDGTVPHACSVLPGAPTFLAPHTEHSTLATDRGVIEAVLDILANRPVRLPSCSSDPADHLVIVPAPTPPLAEPGSPSDVSSRFVESYDTPRARPGELRTGQAEIPPLPPRAAPLRPDNEDDSQVLLSAVTPGASWPATISELILDASDLLPFDFLRTGDRLGRAVVKIQCEDGAVGTGFLVGTGILLTNHHVLPNIQTATGSYALANYEVCPSSDVTGRPAVAPLDPHALFLTNADLDFTFCGVQGLDFLGTVPVDRNSMNVSILDYVNIIQHPRGRPKEVALQDNRVVKADNVVVHYACDTEPGSSGSPVFNNQWRLVALHHASVVTNSPEGRSAMDADPAARYLNEGIRLSAIATWLDAIEPHTLEQREQMTRLRSVFGGLDPQLGFFGALGRRSSGKNAAEVVVNSYQGNANDVDIAYWNVNRLGRRFREHLADVARVVAELGLDLWCLTHAHPASIRALCEHLETNYQLDYGLLVDDQGPNPTSAVIYKRTRVLAVERLAWPAGEFSAAPCEPMRVKLCATTLDGDVAELQLVPVATEGLPERGDDEADSTRLLVAAIGDALSCSSSAGDWILVGDPAALLTPEGINALIETGYQLVTATAERDGTLAFLAGPASRVGPIFVSPNLSPALGSPQHLVVARDRSLPPSLTSLARPHPIAFRLCLDRRSDDAALPCPPPARPVEPEPASQAPDAPPGAAALGTDVDLQQKLMDMLAPMIARLVGELRSQPPGKEGSSF